MTNVPFGMFLFRGLDSSLMVVVASQISMTLKLLMSGVPNFTLSLSALR